MEEFERLGEFYLGKIVDSNDGQVTDQPLLYESKDLTTHAVCVGMTGSGKTGLGIALLEEAGLDKIPAIIIDPKGDLGNLLLTFPTLSAQEFKPWVDDEEAQRKGESLQSYSEEVASAWKKGLSDWGEDAQRIQKLKSAVDMTIYTPASQAGVPLSILSSFAVPSKELLLDSGAIRDRILSLTSSVLGLLGINADPIKSREHILISTIIDQAWKKGSDLTIAALIQQVQKPPFEKIGALDIDTFFPTKDRLALSIILNNLLASPGFQPWLEGEPLDIQKILYTAEGKPKLSIFSIAHLSDSERMFFITLLLNEFISWMRRQPGTSSLRALLYMDEIFGYFPPTAMPPSKIPMLTLLKQARAFGIGVILSTQNPVDLDYKGLANCGTWFIGKLQTERDKARVLEGLTATAANGELKSKDLDNRLALVGKRTFIMRSIYKQDLILFQSRWTLSYLKGPLTLPQIEMLTEKKVPVSPTFNNSSTIGATSEDKSIVPSEISEFFVNLQLSKPDPRYKPHLLGLGRLHFVDAKNKVDQWQDVCLIASPNEDGSSIAWDKGENLPEIKHRLENAPLPGKSYESLPPALMQKKNYSMFEKSLATSLYQNQVLTLYSAAGVDIPSTLGETEGDFRSRLALVMREKRDETIKKIQDKYAEKSRQLNDRLKRAGDKLQQKQQKAGEAKMNSWISFGQTVLGAVMGKRIGKGTLSQAGTSMRRAGRASKESQEATTIQEDYQGLQRQLNDLQEEMRTEVAKATMQLDPMAMPLQTLEIHPRKSDIFIEKVALVWVLS